MSAVGQSEKSERATPDVGFAFENGHIQRPLACLKSANKRHQLEMKETTN
jgi:hypothetical protein